MHHADFRQALAWAGWLVGCSGLQSGKVLIVGGGAALGAPSDGGVLRSAELYL
jgi:hypothetical protein